MMLNESMTVGYGHHNQMAPSLLVTSAPLPDSTTVTSPGVTSRLPLPPPGVTVHRVTDRVPSSLGVTSVTHLPLPMNPSLPPCRVCGGKASGFHYGVNTCQGCRMFFRRMLLKQDPSVCTSSGQCVVNQRDSKKIPCTACKYQLCLKLGMKKSGKKTGRYSHARRTDYTKEIQELELRVKISTRGSKQQPLFSEEERENELDPIAQQLNDVHQKQRHNHSDFITSLEQRETLQKEKEALEKAMFGPMKALSLEDYLSVYNSTGVDIDGRRKFIQSLIPTFESSAYRFINFVKQIPGFLKLPIMDQISLIRATATTCDIVSGYHIFNLDRLIWLDPENHDISLNVNDFSFYHDPEHVQILHRCIQMLQDLDLTPEEQTILYAYLVVTGNTDISAEGREILTPLIDTMEEVLYKVIQKNHDNSGLFFSKVISTILYVTYTMNIWDVEYSKVFHDYPDLPWPAILLNIWK